MFKVKCRFSGISRVECAQNSGLVMPVLKQLTVLVSSGVGTLFTIVHVQDKLDIGCRHITAADPSPPPRSVLLNRILCRPHLRKPPGEIYQRFQETAIGSHYPLC